MNEITKPTNSPWDRVQTCRRLLADVFWVSTAGHGGLMVHKDHVREHLSPAAMKYAMKWGEWYCFEEDCQCSIAFFDNAHIFRAFLEHEPSHEQREQVLHSVKGWEWEFYEFATGETLKPGESHCKDERDFYAAHANEWLGVAATSGTSWDPVPQGFIKVTAALGGRRDPNRPPTRDFLVPELEYCGDRGITENRWKYPWKFAFIVDPTRHQEVKKAA